VHRRIAVACLTSSDREQRHQTVNEFNPHLLGRGWFPSDARERFFLSFSPGSLHSTERCSDIRAGRSDCPPAISSTHYVTMRLASAPYSARVGNLEARYLTLLLSHSPIRTLPFHLSKKHPLHALTCSPSFSFVKTHTRHASLQSDHLPVCFRLLPTRSSRRGRSIPSAQTPDCWISQRRLGQPDQALHLRLQP